MCSALQGGPLGRASHWNGVPYLMLGTCSTGCSLSQCTHCNWRQRCSAMTAPAIAHWHVLIRLSGCARGFLHTGSEACSASGCSCWLQIVECSYGMLQLFTSMSCSADVPGTSCVRSADACPCWLQIIECSFDMERKVWLFMRERTDKDTANHRSVFDKVMTSISDNITVSNCCIPSCAVPDSPGCAMHGSRPAGLGRSHACCPKPLERAQCRDNAIPPMPRCMTCWTWRGGSSAAAERDFSVLLCAAHGVCHLPSIPPLPLVCHLAFRLMPLASCLAYRLLALVHAVAALAVLQQDFLLDVFDEALKLDIYKEDQMWKAGTHPIQLAQQERQLQQQQAPQPLPQHQQEQLAQAANGRPRAHACGCLLSCLLPCCSRVVLACDLDQGLLS